MSVDFWVAICLDAGSTPAASILGELAKSLVNQWFSKFFVILENPYHHALPLKRHYQTKRLKIQLDYPLFHGTLIFKEV